MPPYEKTGCAVEDCKTHTDGLPYKKRILAARNAGVAADAATALPPPITNPVVADPTSQPQPSARGVRIRKGNTGRSVENCKAHTDGLLCPSCNSTKTKFRFFNNKNKAQPRYLCLGCKMVWTAGGKIRGPYQKRGGAKRNPGVAADATTALPPPKSGFVRRRRGLGSVSFN